MAQQKSANKSGFRKEGILFVVSAPSGTGKTTLCQKLLKRMPELKMSVSYTTRELRKGEVDDIDYTFITERKFKGMIERGEFAEWAMVHGNLYGTSLKRLNKLKRDGYDIILDIDVHGASQIRKTCDNAVFIFILPPSFQELKKRLVARKTDSEGTIDRRLKNAREEINGFGTYDFIVINDSLKDAYHDIESIIRSSKLKTSNIDTKWIKGFR